MSDNDRPSLAAVLRDAATMLAAEWRKRTWYGRLHLPLEILYYASIAAILLPVAIGVWYVRVLEEATADLGSLGPPIYRDGRTEPEVAGDE